MFYGGYLVYSEGIKYKIVFKVHEPYRIGDAFWRRLVFLSKCLKVTIRGESERGKRVFFFSD